MYNDRPSTKRIVLTLVGLGVGLLVVFGLIVALSTALAPKTPTDASPTEEPSASVVATPSAASALVQASAPATLTGAPVPPVASPASAASPKRSAVHANSLSGKVVVIDAGHQAHGDASPEPIGPGAAEMKPKVATGATGVQTGNLESLVNLQVARKLQQELLARGANVVMVRTSQNVNISNSKRAGIANDAHADLFVRLHCDGNDNHSMVGLSTLIPKSNRWTRPIVAESKKAGRYVHNAVIAQTGAHDRGVVDRGDLSGFNWAKVPTVLVEMGFLSNPGEDVKLARSEYQQALAVGLANGVEDYLTAK